MPIESKVPTLNLPDRLLAANLQPVLLLRKRVDNVYPARLRRQPTDNVVLVLPPRNAKVYAERACRRGGRNVQKPDDVTRTPPPGVKKKNRGDALVSVARAHDGVAFLRVYICICTFFFSFFFCSTSQPFSRMGSIVP